MADKKPKEVFKAGIVCPHCEKRIVVKKTKTLVQEAVPAEYSEKVLVEKDKQQTIQESAKEAPKKRGRPAKQAPLPKIAGGAVRVPASSQGRPTGLEGSSITSVRARG